MSSFTNQQVLAILRLKGLPKKEKDALQQMADQRGLTAVDFYEEDMKSLHSFLKLFMLLFPFLSNSLLVIQLLLDRSWICNSKQWKQYWFFMSLGYATWFIVVIISSKYIFVF